MHVPRVALASSQHSTQQWHIWDEGSVGRNIRFLIGWTLFSPSPGATGLYHRICMGFGSQESRAHIPALPLFTQ